MKIVVFAGGVGSRLWPLSRKNSPKQFGKIIGEKSTLQQTIERLLPLLKASDIYIATGKRYEDIVKQQLSYIPDENFFFEPEMRDVGPAIGVVASALEKKFPDEPIGIIWSDHLIKNEKEFRKVLLMAEKMVSKKEANFVFVAQKPRFPNQNIGWIELGDKLNQEGKALISNFKKLCYRPELSEAGRFFESGAYVWNLGYFVTTPSYLVSLYKAHVPKMWKDLLKLHQSYSEDGYEEVLEKIYPTLEKISFDDAILQKLSVDNIRVITDDFGWSDVGAWEALKEALASKEEENVTQGDVMVEDSRDSLLFNYNNNQLTVGIDLDGMLVINTEDVLLICPKTAVPKIKKFVEKLADTKHHHLT